MAWSYLSRRVYSHLNDFISFGRDVADGFRHSSSKPDAESPPASQPSITTSSSVEQVLARQSDSEIPNDIVKAPNESPDSNLIELSPASLPSITNSSVDHVLSNQSDYKIPNNIVETLPESNLTESSPASLPAITIPSIDHVLSNKIEKDIVEDQTDEFPESNLAESLHTSPSVANSSIEHALKSQSNSETPNNIVEAPPQSNLAESLPPALLPSITISSIDHVISNQFDADPSPASLLPITNFDTEYVPPRNSIYDSPEPNLNISQLSLLIRSAREPGNKSALKQVRAFFKKAVRTLRKKQTPEQVYILTHWDSPSLRGRSSSTLFLPSSPLAQSSSLSLSFLKIFVDASFHGIGFIFNDRWLAWTFNLNHPNIVVGPDNNIIMHWAELIAVELGILTLLAGGYRDIQVLVMSDNMDVVSALKKKKWTRKHGLDIILARILRLCETASLELKAEWISTKENPADGPSRREYPPADMMVDHIPNIPQHLEGMLNQAGVA